MYYTTVWMLRSNWFGGTFILKLISMEKEIERRSIINVLRNMDVGAIEVFPIIQKTSVTYTLNARLYKEKAEGMVWKTKSDVKNMQFIVTRIA